MSVVLDFAVYRKSNIYYHAAKEPPVSRAVKLAGCRLH